jgi:hypothetical protein
MDHPASYLKVDETPDQLTVNRTSAAMSAALEEENSDQVSILR